MKNAIIGFFKQDWSLPEKLLLSAAVFFFGVIFGFLLAPDREKIWHCGNNNGNNTCDPKLDSEQTD